MVLPEMLPALAVIVVWPVASEVARPPATTLATLAAEEVHVTDDVRFCVLPSLKVPVALHCSVLPSGMEGF